MTDSSSASILSADNAVAPRRASIAEESFIKVLDKNREAVEISAGKIIHAPTELLLHQYSLEKPSGIKEFLFPLFFPLTNDLLKGDELLSYIRDSSFLKSVRGGQEIQDYVFYLRKDFSKILNRFHPSPEEGLEQFLDGSSTSITKAFKVLVNDLGDINSNYSSITKGLGLLNIDKHPSTISAYSIPVPLPAQKEDPDKDGGLIPTQEIIHASKILGTVVRITSESMIVLFDQDGLQEEREFLWEQLSVDRCSIKCGMEFEASLELRLTPTPNVEKINKELGAIYESLQEEFEESYERSKALIEASDTRDSEDKQELANQEVVEIRTRSRSNK